MIELDFLGIKLRFTFAFFALVGLVCQTGASAQMRVIIVIICSVMHEAGHIAAMCFFGHRPDSLTFCAGGICLPEKALNCSGKARAIILLSGCAVNFITAAVSILLGYKGMFAAVHLILGVFNLLPFRYFDGGRLYSELKGREVGTAVKAASLLPLACIGVYSVLNGKLPLSLIAAVILILLDGRS